MKPPDMELVGGIDIREGTLFGTEVVPAGGKIDAFLNEKKPDVLIDFTVAAAAVENIKAAARNDVALVVGTTGGFSPRAADDDRERRRRNRPGGDIEQLLRRRQHLLETRAGSGTRAR